jgi:hypothetical protein
MKLRKKERLWNEAFLEICEHFVSIWKGIDSVVERDHQRSSSQAQQKRPPYDGLICWVLIAGEGFEPPTFGL